MSLMKYRKMQKNIENDSSTEVINSSVLYVVGYALIF